MFVQQLSLHALGPARLVACGYLVPNSRCNAQNIGLGLEGTNMDNGRGISNE